MNGVSPSRKRVKSKTPLVVVLILMSIPVVFLAVNFVHIQARLFSLRHKNHQIILAACREAIANRESYRKYHTGEWYIHAAFSSPRICA